MTSLARSVAWTQIALQALFPLAMAFTPAVMARDAQTPVSVATSPSGKTEPYVLRAGETVATVAARHGITVAALKKANPHRLFTRDFEHLQAGDKLNIPVAPVSRAPRSPFAVDRLRGGNLLVPPSSDYDDLPSLGIGRPDPAGETLKKDTDSHLRDSRDPAAEKLASVASTAGGILQNGHAGDAAASMARGMAEGKLNQTVQDWFSHFGNARVQLNADEKFSLKNSEFDLLHPWWDTPENMLFSQGSLHRTDDRTQANLGLGWRHWATGAAPYGLLHGNYMTGLNTFLDYDLSRDHARLGVGAEFWRDYFKAGANVYHRLTNWKTSPDIEDYEERPADGWDIRTEGWLPAYPQLGAKLTYEQYYGNDVGLFGYDNLQKDPHAFTAGLTWTPFPLMTLTAEQRQGKQGENDSRVGVEFTWHPDQSWQSQTDPEAVSAMRTLSGNRYDFVARNNNIVLEYRRKEVIAIALPERVEGRSGVSYPLNVTVSKAKYGLRGIEWDAPAFFAAGGQITGAGNVWQIRMPAWHPTGNNTWTVGATATDRHGNTSDRVQTTVVVTGAGVSARQSTLTPARGTLLADGQSQTVVTATLKGEDGQPVTGLAADLSLTGVLTPDAGPVDVKAMHSRAAAGKDVTLSALKETQPGVYVSTLTAGTTAGKYALSLAYAGNRLLASQVLLTDTLADLGASTLTADKTTVVASDGTDPAGIVHLTLAMKDKAGKPVSGEAGRLSFFIPAANVNTARITLSDLKEDSGKPGMYTGTLSSTLAMKDMPVGLKVNGKDSGKRVQITVTADPLSARPVVTVTKDKAVADGQDTDALNISVADRFGNQAEGLPVALSADTADQVTFTAASVTTGADGQVAATLTAVTPGEKTVTVRLKNNESVDAKVHFIPDPNATVQGLTVTDNNGRQTDERPVGVTDASKFIVTADVRDAAGNPAPPNLTVNWTLDQSTCPVAAAALAAASSKTDSHGHAVMTVTSAAPHKVCDSIQVSAVVDGATRAARATLKYRAEEASANVKSLKMTSAGTHLLADGKAHADYLAEVTDQYDNPVKQIQVAWSATAGTLPTPTTTGADGSTTNALTSTTAAVDDLVRAWVVRSGGSTGTPMAADKTVTFNTITLVDMTADAAEKTVGDGPGSTFTFTALVKDNDGQPYPGAVVTWSQDGGSDYVLPATQVTTDSQGKAVVTLTNPGHKARKDIRVTASLGTRSVTQNVTWKADAATARVKTVSLVNPGVTTHLADGTSAFKWTAQVVDQYGNAVDNITVHWSSSVTGPVFGGDTITDASGNAVGDMTSTVAVPVVHGVAAATSGITTPVQSAQTVSFLVSGAATLTVAMNKDKAVADGKDEDEMTVTATSPAGLPLAGETLTVDLSTTPDIIPVSGKTTVLDGHGQAVVHLASKKAGLHNIIVSVPDSAAAKAAQKSVLATFIPGPVSAATSDVIIPVDAASQGDALEVRIYARDANRNAIPLDGKRVAITPSTTGVTFDTAARRVTAPDGAIYLAADVTPRAWPFAIRHNTVDVSVDGVVIAKAKKLRWSPDLYICPPGTGGWLNTACKTEYTMQMLKAGSGHGIGVLKVGTGDMIVSAGEIFPEITDIETGAKVNVHQKERELTRLEMPDGAGGVVSPGNPRTVKLMGFHQHGGNTITGDNKYVGWDTSAILTKNGEFNKGDIAVMNGVTNGGGLEVDQATCFSNMQTWDKSSVAGYCPDRANEDNNSPTKTAAYQEDKTRLMEVRSDRIYWSGSLGAWAYAEANDNKKFKGNGTFLAAKKGANNGLDMSVPATQIGNNTVYVTPEKGLGSKGEDYRTWIQGTESVPWNSYGYGVVTSLRFDG